MVFVLFFALIHSNRKINIYAGYVSTEVNPFWSNEIPGIHNCPYSTSEDGYDLKIRYTSLERMLKIPLNTTSPIYKHCPFKIRKYEMKLYTKLAKENAFLRFHTTKAVFRSPFYQRKNNSLEYFTHFKIILDNTTIPEKLEVIPSKPQVVQLDSKIQFSFELQYGHIESQISQSESSPTSAKYIGIFLLIVLISIILYLIIIHSNPLNHILSQNDIWRVDESIENVLFFVFAFIIFLFIYIMFLFTYDSNKPIERYFFKILFIPTLFGVSFISYFCRIVSLDADEAYWLSPVLLYYMLMMFTFRIANFIFNMFWSSHLGYSLLYVIPNDILLISCISIFTRGIGIATKRLPPICKIKFVKEESNIPQNSKSLIQKLISLIYIIIIICLIYPIIQNIFELLYNDQKFDFDLLENVLLIFGPLSGLYSLMKTIPRLKNKAQEPWQRDHIFVHMIISFFVVLVSFVKYLITVKTFDFQSFAYTALFVVPLAMAMLIFGSGCSYLASFIPIIVTYSQRKNN